MDLDYIAGGLVLLICLVGTAEFLHRTVNFLVGPRAAKVAVIALIAVNAAGAYAAWARISEAYVWLVIMQLVITLGYAVATGKEWVEEAKKEVPVGPCPSCGSKDGSPILESPETGSWKVLCTCGAKGPSGYGPVAAIKEWNKAYREAPG